MAMDEPAVLRVGLHRSLTTVDAEVKYVLDTLLRVAGFAYHFCWAEPGADVDIYYGPSSDPPARAPVSIRASGRAFSDASHLEPRRLGETDGVPWLDFGEPEAGIKTLPDGRLVFTSDIVFAAYWLLTGAREAGYARTRWDDLRLAGSAFLTLGLASRPLVSIWGAQLANHFVRRGLHPWPAGWARAQGATTFVFTHDVDYPQMIRWIECLRLLRARGPRALSSIAGVVRGTNHFWKFGEWMDFERRLGARSAFFFMARRGSLRQYALGVPDAFYDIHKPEFREIFQRLVDGGFEIGLHASFNAYQSAEQLRHEKTALEAAAGVTVEGNRHHYWRLDPDAPHETLRRHAVAGLVYDSSLGFEFYPGFRRGICHPFRPFHPGHRRALDIIELPPAWMDSHFDGRLAENRIADPDAHARQLLDVSRGTGGVVVVDYHVRGMNSDFFPRWGSWLTTFAARNFDDTIAFATPGEVARQYREYERRLREVSRDDAGTGPDAAIAFDIAVGPMRPEEGRGAGRAAPSRERLAAYLPEVLAQTGRLLGMADREADSVTYGSFDRDHWSWKFRDLPLGMLQGATYPLALLWAAPLPGNPYYGQSRLLEWILGALGHTLDRQYPSGAFDAFCPNENDPGATLGVLHGLIETWRLVRGEASASLESRTLEAFRRAGTYVYGHYESHGFVSNHQALFAVAYLGAAEFLGEPRYRQAAEDLVERVFRAQSADGWYREYDGPDPGYESLGIFHLATFWRRTGMPRLLDSLRRSIEFYSHCVHPDGSVGGVYGSRHTRLYFPGGFEALAGEVPMAAAIARFMREHLARHNAVAPASSDAENLPSLMYSYLEACLVPAPPPPTQPALPCEALEGVRPFPDSGLVAVGTRTYYAILSGTKGGVCRVFDKHRAELAYEDSGYVVRAGKRTWTSQLSGLGGRVDLPHPTTLVCSTQLAEVPSVALSPAGFLVLRLLNVTLFRSRRLAARFRRFIVRRLIRYRRPGPIRLVRTVTFEPAAVRFHDRLEVERPLRVDSVSLPRAFTAIHSGSAKYFHLTDLLRTPEVDVRSLAAELTRSNAAEHEFMLCLSPGTAATILTGAPALGRTHPTVALSQR